MDQNYCDITILLDRSGSMESIKGDMERGFVHFIGEQRKLPGKCTVTLVQFDTQGIDTVYEAREIKDVPFLTLAPRGGTPLLDALNTTIGRTGTRLAGLPEAVRPGKVVFMVITDGEENSSRYTTLEQIKNTIKHQSEQYNWQFLYLGANVDAFGNAQAMGIPTAGAANYGANTRGVAAAFSAASESLGRYRDGSSVGATFTVEEQGKLGETVDP